MQDPRSFLSRILEIIEYTGDREKFVEDFLINIKLEAIINVINNKYPDKKDIFKQSIKELKTPEQVKEFIANNISEDDYVKEIEEVTPKAMNEYFRAIEPTLNDQQRVNLQSLSSH